MRSSFKSAKPEIGIHQYASLLSALQEFHVLQYDEYVDEEKKKIFPSTSNGEYTAILYVKYIADINSPP